MPRLLSAAILLLLLLPAAPARAASGCPKGAQCGKVTVPLDRSGHTPGTLGVAYARFAASGTRTGTLVLLSGGPGEAAIPVVKEVAPILAQLRDSYNIVYVDQRGTGGSGAVDCLKGDVEHLAAKCALALGAAAPYMTTAETAEDLESLRTALGADRLTLLGVSYGTQVARAYARRHPDHTAAVVLDSTVGAKWLDGLDRPNVDELARVLGEVCGDCGVPDARAALLAAGNRLLHGSLRVPLVLSRQGRIGHARLSEALLYVLLASSDGSPAVRERLPAAIAALASGDGAPLEHLAVVEVSGLFGASVQDLEGVNFARHLATACVERQFPWAPDAPVAGRRATLKTAVAQLGEGAFAPFGSKTILAAGETSVCSQWPAFPPPPAEPAGPEPDVPVLILSGREDLRTPLEDAHAVAAAYPRATLVAVPGVAHSVLVNEGRKCARRALAVFLAQQPVAGCDAEPATASRPAAEHVLPARLVRGQERDAVAATLSGIVGDLRIGAIGAPWVPGLRGGTFRVRKGRVELSRVEWVRGVRLTGTLGRRSRVSVSGRVHGRLAGRGDRIGGRLDGRRAAFRLR